MERRAIPTATRKRRRRMTLLWSVTVAAIIIILLVTEQVALLYVLGTLSVAALLIIVAVADLGGAQRVPAEPAPRDDAAAIADGVTAPATAFAASGRQGAKRRRGR